jgi:hypothetical protein
VKTTIAELLLFLFSTFAVAQRASAPHSVDHVPRVISAEVPFYPPSAWSAHFGGTIETEVTVERGIVTRTELKSAVVRSQDDTVIRDDQKLIPYLLNAVEENLKTWRFASDENTTFRVIYTYRIEGSETAAPVTPIVLLELPTRITVTARPFKPTTT